MALLKVNNIDVSYGKIQVLWDFSLEVEEGEIVALLGPNGAGKTTTLNTISGVVKPTSGNIMYRDTDITKLPPSRINQKGIAQVPEGRHVFPKLSVFKNLKAAAYSEKARKHFEENLEFIYNFFPRISERRRQKAGTLSGGERQMLAIARALMTQPDLLLLDEPTLGLQPDLVDEVFKLIPQLNEQGYTILIVEQNIRKCLEIAERGYLIEEGRNVLKGSRSELRNSDYVKEAYLGIT